MFTPVLEKDCVIFRDEGNTMLFKEYIAAVVTEVVNADEIVFESCHNLAVVDR